MFGVLAHCRLLPAMFLPLLAIAVVADSAMAQQAKHSDQEIEFFEKQIRPLLRKHCFECHAGEENNGGLLLDTDQAWRAGGDTGAKRSQDY